MTDTLCTDLFSDALLATVDWSHMTDPVGFASLMCFLWEHSEQGEYWRTQVMMREDEDDEDYEPLFEMPDFS
jgi:hypothetical protein